MGVVNGPGHRTTRAPATPRSADASATAKVTRDVVKDRRVTDAEWDGKLRPALEKAALESAEVRAFVDVYADGKVAFGPRAATEAAALLQRHGYDVPASRDAVKMDVRIIVEGNAAAADPAFERLSALTGTQAAELAIAVVDGGFSSHPVLADNLSRDGRTMKARYGAALGKSFGEFSAQAREEGAMHGTHVAGIATRGTPRIKAALLAVPLATVEEQRDPGGAGPTSRPPRKEPIVLALDHAAAHGARVVNVSIEAFVDERQAQAYREVMERHPGTLFLFGAGNDHYELGSATEGDKTLVERLRLPNMAVVGASYPDGGMWGQSNHGAKHVDLAARGHLVASADGDGDGFRTESGTSMATPNVTNLAAKCLLLDPTLVPAQVVKLLAATSDAHWSWKDKVASGGTVDAERAMTAAAVRTLVRAGSTMKAALDRVDAKGADRATIERALASLES